MKESAGLGRATSAFPGPDVGGGGEGDEDDDESTRTAHNDVNDARIVRDRLLRPDHLQVLILLLRHRQIWNQCIQNYYYYSELLNHISDKETIIGKIKIPI